MLNNSHRYYCDITMNSNIRGAMVRVRRLPINPADEMEVADCAGFNLVKVIDELDLTKM